MIVILAEKPSARKNFLTALGGNTKTGCGTYKGETYKVTASHGHLLGLLAPEKQVDEELQEKYKSWKLADLPWDLDDFHWKKGLLPKASGTLKAIREDLKDADEVVIATDDDPSGEGELLAWEILHACRWKGKTSRMYFADESVKEVQKAFENRKDLTTSREDGDYVKALARERWDFLSIQYTRAATAIAKEKGLPGGIALRQGRLKSVMVSLVGDQQDAYENYVKKPYFEARYKDENGNVYKRDPEKEKEKIRFDKKEDVDLSPLSPSEVVVDGKRLKRRPPGKLLDLAGIVAIMAEKGYKTKLVTDTYQTMYENHIVSYPRTEDKTITIEQFNDLLPLADKIAGVVGVDPRLLTHRTPRKTHVKKGGAHGANRPGTSVPESLSQLEQKYGKAAPLIYQIVAKNYLAMLAEDYEYEQQKGHIKDHPEFTAVCSVPKALGFKEVFDAGEKDKDESTGLGTSAESFVYEGANTRPQKPTIKWLVKRLEKYNVGTGATRSSTIAEITDEKKENALMKEKKGALSLTEVGKASSQLIKGCRIASPEVTEKLFKEMEEVGRFERDKNELLQGITGLLLADEKIMEENSRKMQIEITSDKTIGRCPLCGKAVREYDRSYSCTGWKDGCPFVVWKEVSGHRVTKKEAVQLVDGEMIGPLKFKSKAGKPYQAYLYYDMDKKKMQVKFPERKKVASCPLCGKDIVEYDNRYSCSDWKGCGLTVWKEQGGHKITKGELEKLLAGETVGPFKMKSKAGKKFTASMVLNKKEKKIAFVFPERRAVGTCPICGKKLLDCGTYFACEDKKECGLIIWKKINGHTIVEDELARLLSGEKIGPVQMITKAGKAYRACIKIDRKEKKVKLSFPERKVIGTCPVCGKDVVEYDKSYSCTGWKAGCKVTIWKDTGGHQVTEEEAKTLLDGEMVGPVKITDRDGDTKKVLLYLNKELGRVVARVESEE